MMNRDLADQARRLLRRAHTLKEQHSSEMLALVGTLLKNCKSTRRDYQEKAKDTAPDHNIFRLLGIERYEVWLHSPYLADLLDPYGTHGQGILFLRTFFEMLANHPPYKSARDHREDLSIVAHEISEQSFTGGWVIGRERERIDISIRHQKIGGGTLIFIENKVDAEEQPHQLKRYRDRLDNLTTYKLRLLVFLTPSIRQPGSGEPHIHLTYKDDVLPWLQSCLCSIHADRVKYTLDQYIESVDQLVKET